MPRSGPAPRASSSRTRSTGPCSSRSSRTRCSPGASEPSPSRSSTTRSTVVGERTAGDALATLKRALDNTRPELEVRSRRVGGTTYQVPVEVRPRRATTLSIRWIVSYARQRRDRTMALKLANEILDAANGLGAAVKRREDIHKMAESNRAFAHYRW